MWHSPSNSPSGMWQKWPSSQSVELLHMTESHNAKSYDFKVTVIKQFCNVNIIWCIPFGLGSGAVVVKLIAEYFKGVNILWMWQCPSDSPSDMKHISPSLHSLELLHGTRIHKNYNVMGDYFKIIDLILNCQIF